MLKTSLICCVTTHPATHTLTDLKGQRTVGRQTSNQRLKEIQFSTGAKTNKQTSKRKQHPWLGMQLLVC